MQRLRREDGNGLKEQTAGADALATIKNELKSKIKALQKLDQRASVDSELALVKREASYPLSGWLANPYFLGYQGQDLAISRDDVVLVCRLDGPDGTTVRRLIDDSLEVENNGLQGRAYFDARWSRPTETVVSSVYGTNHQDPFD